MSSIPSTVQQSATDWHRELYEESPIAYHELDVHGTIRSVNNAMCRLLRYSPEQLAGRPVWDFCTRDERAVTRLHVVRKLALEQELKPTTSEWLRSDGRPLWLEAHDTLILSPAGEVRGLRSALLDTTRRHQTERELQENSGWLRAVLLSIGEGVVATDVLGLVKFMNAEAERMTGWKEEDARGMIFEHVCRVMPEGDDGRTEAGGHRSLFDAVCSGSSKGASLRSARLLRRGGGSLPVWVTLSPVSDAAGHMTGAVLVMGELAG
jgi:PAS domain S-box-containing protein